MRRKTRARLRASDLEARLTALGPAGFADLLEFDAQQQGDGVVIRCPLHDDTNPSASITIGERGTLRLKCFGCDETCDVHDVVAAVHDLDLKTQFRDVLALEAELLGAEALIPQRGGREPTKPRSRDHPPLDEVIALWADAPLLDSIEVEDLQGSLGVHRFLRDRGIDLETIARLDLARRVPDSGIKLPDWFPSQWTYNYRLALLGFDHRGDIRSVHLRAVFGTADAPKSLWPKGYRASGLVLCNARSRHFLKELGSTPDEFVFLEGVPDFLAGCAWVDQEHRGAAVIGVGSMSGPFFSKVTWPAEATYTIITHSDEAGRRYASQIIGALPPSAQVRVVDLAELAGGDESPDFDETPDEVRDHIFQMPTVEASAYLRAGGLHAYGRPEWAAVLRQEGSEAWVDAIERSVRGADAASIGRIVHDALDELTSRGVTEEKAMEFVTKARGRPSDNEEAVVSTV